MQYYNPHFLFCTFFGLGKFFKRFPGTIGSLIAVPLAYFVTWFSLLILNFFPAYSDLYIARFFAPVCTLAILFFIGVYSSSKYSAQIKVEDPKEVIIDEIIAQMLCMVLSLPLTFNLISQNLAGKTVIYYDVVFILAILGNFVLFRFFDIVKPWPISWVDKKIHGGFGIMFDDIVAAIFALVIYFAVLFSIIDFYVGRTGA